MAARSVRGLSLNLMSQCLISDHRWPMCDPQSLIRHCDIKFNDRPLKLYRAITQWVFTNLHKKKCAEIRKIMAKIMFILKLQGYPWLLQFSHPYPSFLVPLLHFSHILLLMTHIFTCDSSYNSFLYFDSCIYLLSFGICCTFTGM